MILSGVSLATLFAATPAIAQQPGAADEEEIVVTAQKREQFIQDVPIAVTALSGNQLEQAGVADIRALQTISASINLNSTQTESGGTTLRIRGVGTTGNNAGLESAVGVFIDGVYVSRPSIALGELLDVQQVEILRGPQGTLFGRNTSAGALTVATRKPNLDSFGVFANTTIGAIDGGDIGGLFSAQAGVNIPLVEEKLAIRLSAAARARDGLLTSTQGIEQNSRDRYYLRGQALWAPAPNFDVRFIADYQQGNDDCCDAVIIGESPFVSAYAAVGAPGGGVTASGPSAVENRISNSQLFKDPGEQTGFSAEANWDLDWGQITYIGSFRDSKAGQNVQESDFVGLQNFTVGGVGSVPQAANNNYGKTEYTSHEFRISGEAGRLNWLVGAYYAKEDIEVSGVLSAGVDFQRNTNANIYALLGAAGLTTPTAIVTALTPALGGAGAVAFATNPSGFLSNGGDPNGAFAHNIFFQNGESTSFFTHNTFAVTDRLDLTLGARWVDETKDGRFIQPSAVNLACAGALANNAALAGNPTLAANPIIGATSTVRAVNTAYNCFPFATPANFPGAGTPANPLTPALFNRSFSDDELVYTANASFKVTDDVNTYVSYTHGFKSGGFNLDPTAAAGGADPRFNSELIDSIEFGLKGDFFDGRLRANFAIFSSEMEDFQVLEFTGVQFVTFNVPKVEAKGFEAEFQGAVTENLGLSLAYTYSDAAYPSDCAAGLVGTAARVVGTLCGSPLTNAPENVAIGGFNYARDIGTNNRFYASGSVRYESDRRTSTQPYIVNAAAPLRTILTPLDIQEANTKTNLRMGIGSQSESWAIEFWGTNIFNEQTRNVTFNVPLRGVAQFSARGAFLEEPAIYGVTLRANY
jgi:outer membrane receptor protein involved in Fe transport